MKRILLPTLKNYKKSYFTNDVIAGLIVAALSIPISMGYAQIAGLPAQYGLYGSVVPILLFALFSTSPQFVMGVDAAPAALVGGALASLGYAQGSKEAMAIVPVITIMTAAWLFLFSGLRMGKLVNYISMPVMGGFISGISFTIILMQVPKLMGYGTVTGKLFVLISGIVEVMDKINYVSLALGVGTIVISLVSKKYMPKFPMSVLLMIAGVVLTIVFHIDERYDVALLAAVEPGLPKLQEFHFGDWDYLGIAETAFSVALVITANSLLAENNFATKNGYTIDKNREIFAFGLANLGSAMIGGCPINGSVSRTSMTEQFESKSQMASLVAGCSMILLLLFGTGFIEYLPVPVLTGIVMAALLGVIDWKLAKRLYKECKVELFIFFGAFFGVLVLGTVEGVVVGICLSFVDVLIRASKSPSSFLGVIPGKNGFYGLERSSGARKIKETVIYRFSGSLFFANVGKFEQDIEDSIQEDTKYIIVDAAGINDIDMTAADRLAALHKRLESKGIRFFITEHTGELNDKLRQYGAGNLVEEGVARRTISTALRDVHLYPPYPLEGNTEEHMEYALTPGNRSLSEFEWAFGKEATAYMEAYAKEVLEHLSKEDGKNIANGWYLEHQATKRWKKLGHADEQILLYHLELHLKEMSEKLGENEKRIEEELEKRRMFIDECMKLESQEEYERLKKKFEQFEEKMKEERPVLYEEIMTIRKRIEEAKREHDTIDKDFKCDKENEKLTIM